MRALKDDNFRLPRDVYFESEVVRKVLGDNAHFAVIPSTHAEANADFYRWLGVADQPRLPAIVGRITAITADPPSDNAINEIRVLFGHLGSRLAEDSADVQLSSLKKRKWLPAKGDRSKWYFPEAVYADFTAYLFESQAQFLDVPQRVQQTNTGLLEYLGIRSSPTEQQVVAHLLHCAESSKEVNKEVYRWLNDRAHHPAITRLKDTRCLILPDGTYVRPSDVFWQPHPFGRYRWQLKPELRRYNDLFRTLEVREEPGVSDAGSVLDAIWADFNPHRRQLDDDARTILMACWRMLEQSSVNEEVSIQQLNKLSSLECICAPNGLLTRPDRLFFDDRPGLAAKFATFLQDNILPRPEGAWRAMEAAGVRPLSTAVESHLVETIDVVDGSHVLNQIHQRRNQLARILDFHTPGLANNLSRLDDIQCLAARELKVAYILRAFKRELPSPPEAVQAHYLPEKSTLYFASVTDRPPWAAIARELATVISPDEEPGRLALFLKEVLSADDLSAAKSALDELHIPDLDSATSVAAIPSAAIDDLGGQTSVQDTEGLSVDVPAIPPSEQTPTNAEEAVGSILGAELSSPTGLPPELNQPEHAGASAGGPATSGTPGAGRDSAGHDRTPHSRSPSSKPRGTGDRPGYAVLRSYVMPDRAPDGSLPDDVAQKRRTEVDQAGVDRVMQFEQDQERVPNEMPPKHPGYDVESSNGEGHVERYIEVKSLSGDWRGADAGLTRTQFEKAAEIGGRYWLYVVERAQRDDFTIHCIQDPAGKANRFMFDPGWKQVADETRNDATDEETNG